MTSEGADGKTVHGCALIEAAVRWSEGCGCSGNVSAWTLNKKVRGGYLHYGLQDSNFRNEPKPGMMTLNLHTRDAWQKANDGWLIKAKIGKDYAVSRPKTRALFNAVDLRSATGIFGLSELSLKK